MNTDPVESQVARHPLSAGQEAEIEAERLADKAELDRMASDPKVDEADYQEAAAVSGMKTLRRLEALGLPVTIDNLAKY